MMPPASSQKEPRAPLALLADAGERLAACVDLATTLEVAAAVAAGAIGGRSAIYLVGAQGKPERVATSGEDPGGDRDWTTLSDGQADALRRVLQSGGSVAVPDDDAHFPLADGAAGMHRWLVVSLTVRGCVQGALLCVRLDRVRFGADEIVLMQELGRMIAMAIDNARLQQSAENAIQAGERLLSRASHELRSPLSALRLAVQIALSRMRRGEPLDAAVLEKALVLTDRINALIGDFLAASSPGGQAPLELQELDVRDWLTESVEAFRSRQPRRQVVLDEPDGGVGLMGDRRQLDRMLSHVLDNAAKFSEEGTPIRVSATASRDQVVIAIADQGIGIPPAESPRVCERFFRASNAGTISSQGLGVGLYLSRHIAQAHQGRIWAESELGNGSVFRIALPLTRANP